VIRQLPGLLLEWHSNIQALATFIPKLCDCRQESIFRNLNGTVLKRNIALLCKHLVNAG
jgi:hypothetical protein